MRLIRTAASALLATALVATLTAAPAWAHNSLVEASPAKNATLTEAPEQVELTFLQKLDPDLLTIVVTGADKQPVPVGAPEADGKVGRVAFEQPPANGAYTVAYRVVSQDGHPVQGSYKFTVSAAASAAPAEPSATASVAPSPVVSSAAPAAVTSIAPELAAAADEGGTSWGLIIGVIALILVLVGGVVVALRKWAR